MLEAAVKKFRFDSFYHFSYKIKKKKSLDLK